MENLLNLYDVFVTFVTLYEYIRGLRKVGKNEEELIAIDRYLKKVFEVIWLTNKTLLIASRIWKELSDKGEILDDRDILIGALCIERNLPLWTLNEKHFKRLTIYGLELIKPAAKLFS
ncbi:MAG: type II toxin-antitoxin system VapC family toxin [Candidatus Njordarchaeales archaeon]